MRTQYHFIISLILASIFYILTSSITGSILFFLVGFLMDVDHWLDYWLSSGKINFNVRELFEYSYQCKYKKIHLIFHSIELLPIILLLGNYFFNRILTYGIVLGFLSHLISDYIGNSVKPLSYFFTYRLIKKFEFWEIVDKKRFEKSKKGNK
ncbi:MAG: hypothetical protein QXY45_01200 [Candidatus Aenigmatarchaeota archaeon]